MNSIIAILAVTTALVCAYGGSGGPRFPERPGPRGPNGSPYLRYVPKWGRREYHDIIMNRKLTFAEQKANIDKWAERYKVKDKVDEFNAEMTKKEEEAEQKVTELIGKLAYAQKKFPNFSKRKNRPLYNFLRL